MHLLEDEIRNEIVSIRSRLVGLKAEAIEMAEQIKIEEGAKNSGLRYWLNAFGLMSPHREHGLRSEQHKLEELIEEHERQLAVNEAILSENIPAEQRRHRHKITIKAQIQQAKKEKQSSEYWNCMAERDFDRRRFIIRTKDYKRGNPVDNLVRQRLADWILAAFKHACINCSANEDLTFDHFWLPKNEGGSSPKCGVNSSPKR